MAIVKKSISRFLWICKFWGTLNSTNIGFETFTVCMSVGPLASKITEPIPVCMLTNQNPKNKIRFLLINYSNDLKIFVLNNK